MFFPTSVFGLQNMADFHIFSISVTDSQPNIGAFFEFVGNTLSVEKGFFLFLAKEITWVI